MQSDYLERVNDAVLFLRMKKLKEEMEGVVKELAENNHFLERYHNDKNVIRLQPFLAHMPIRIWTLN